MASDYFTVNEMAAKLNMSRTHIRKLVEQNEIPTVIRDGEPLITANEVEVFKLRVGVERHELAGRFKDLPHARERLIEKLIEEM